MTNLPSAGVSGNPSTAHTPGPWKPKSAIAPQWTVDTKDAFICQTLGGNDEANARLIAAAPRLLAACRRIVEQINAGDIAEPGSAEFSWDDEDSSAAPVFLHDVIAEAEGTD